MKKFIIAIPLIGLLAILTVCGGGGNDQSAAPQMPPVIQPDDPTPDPTPSGPRTVFIYDAAAQRIGTSDGVNYYDLDTGHVTNAGDGFIAVDDVLHGVDDTGTSIISQWLPVIPDVVAISGDVWCFQNIDPDTSASLGALPMWHTKIWRGSEEYGAWSLNQWQTVSAVVTDSGDVVIIDTVGKYRNIQDSAMAVNYAGDGGIMIYDVDIGTRRANIRDISGDYRVAFLENYFISSRPYIEAGGVYYSWNGHTFSGGILTERATIMHEFVTLWYADRPVLAAVGSRIEHSEAVTYWIECNTGWLYRHTPSINRLEEIVRLYQGSGDRTDGLNARDEIKPVLADDNLFFGWNGTVWKYNFTDALVSSFAAGVEIWGM